MVKEDDLNTIGLNGFKKPSDKEPILPAIQCTFYSFCQYIHRHVHLNCLITSLGSLLILFQSQCISGLSDFLLGCSMCRFSNFISLHGLMDIPLEGGLYTWSNTSFASRIDWFLVSPLLADHFTQFSQKRMSRVLSDHFLILMEGGS